MRRIAIGLGVLALAAATAPTALGAKPPSKSDTGTGRVFVPNPVADLGVGTFAFRESLTDQKDADFPALAPAYHEETLTNLDGSGFLRGDYATVVTSTGNLAYSPTNTFDYNRTQDEFEQVMAYYWITEAQKYIQSLGFGSSLPITTSRNEFASTSWESITHSRPTIRGWRSASGRAASTTRRTPR